MNVPTKAQKYADAWQDFCQQEGNEDALRKLLELNHTSGGAPNVSLVGMSLSGAFSQGANDSLTRMAKIKFPTPISSGSLSHLPARQRWMDWHMRIIRDSIMESYGPKQLYTVTTRLKDQKGDHACGLQEIGDLVHQNWVYRRRYLFTLIRDGTLLSRMYV